MSAQLNGPSGIALDSTSNMFIAESGNHRVRKIDAEGVVSTLAGTGQFGYGGDGGPAGEAQFSAPGNVAADESGSVYVVDGGNHRVRVVRPASRFSVELGQSGESIELLALRDGTVAEEGKRLENGHLVADSSGQTYALIPGFGGGVIAIRVQQTQSVHLIGGATLTLAQFADGSWRVAGRRVQNGYRHVSAEQESILELADGTWRLARFIIRTVAGTTDVTEGSPAISADFLIPSGLAVDAAGNVYVADSWVRRVRKIDSSGLINTVAGTGEWGYRGDGGPAIEARFYASSPRDVAVDANGNLFVSDTNRYRVRKIDTEGIISTVAGTGEWGFSGDGGPATRARIGNPFGVTVDSSGNLFFADASTNRVRKVDTAGIISSVAGTGERGFSGDGGPATEAQLYFPIALAVAPSGDLYLADRSNQRVRRIDTSGVISTIAGTGERGFGGDGGVATEAQLSNPTGIAIDTSGNVYVADSSNNRVRKIAPSGIITTIAGTGERGSEGDGGPGTSAKIDGPSALAVDAAGNLYLAEHSQSRRIRKVAVGGVISTIAGKGASTSKWMDQSRRERSTSAFLQARQWTLQGTCTSLTKTASGSWTRQGMFLGLPARATLGA